MYSIVYNINKQRERERERQRERDERRETERQRDRETERETERDRKSTRLNSSHGYISYAVFCLKKKTKYTIKRAPNSKIIQIYKLRSYNPLC